MLDMFFEPESVAVIGASRKPNSAGHGILRSLLKGGVFRYKTNRPFRGRIYAINPNADKVQGKRCYKSVTDIKKTIDLAVIAVPAKIVLSVMQDCAKKRIKGVIIISAGFGETGETGRQLELQVLSVAKKAKIRILGPNCLGIMRPSSNLNASFGPCMPIDGNVAFFSQSGALVDSVIDWSLERKYGFSSVVSLGNKTDLTFSDLLLWAQQDKITTAIALYLEGINDGKQFMATAKKVSKTKPIIALKAGRTLTGIKAVSSHTGSLAGSYEIYKTVFNQCGIHTADNVDELFEMAEALANQPPCKKNSIAIITNGGGAGVLCADHCESLGIKLAELSKKTLITMERSGKMHPAYSRRNPLDLVGDALHDRYMVAIDTVLQQKDVYGLIVIQTLQTMTEPMLDARAVLSARKKYPDKPIITAYMGGNFSRNAVELLEANHVPDFNVPNKAAVAMKALIDRGRYLQL
jgi:acetyl coenzyme A synthetase (ADP forming)-like protein